MSDVIKVGDVVTLKSGGPAMTVSEPTFDGKGWHCVWFVDGKEMSGVYNQEVLENVF